MTTTNRIEYIDNIKGVCIILVVLWHCLQFCGFEDIQYNKTVMAFLMPLFFFLSGIFFRPYDSFATFLKKKVNSLLIPFLLFYYTTCAPLFLVRSAIHHTLTMASLINALFMWITEFYENQALWFILCLFNISMLFYTIYRLSNEFQRSKIVLMLLSVCLGIIGCLLSINKINLYMNLDSALTCLPYFYLGYCLKNYTSLLSRRPDIKSVWIILLLLVSILLLTYDKSIPGYFSNIFNESFYLVYAAGGTGCIFVLLIFRFTEYNRVLSYLGQNTLTILAIHYLIIKYFSSHMFAYCKNGIGVLFLTIIMTMTLTIISIPFFNKYLPYFVAKKELL